MKAGNNLEVEVKFLVRDLDLLRHRLIEAGAKLVKARVFERNVRLDDEQQRLLRRGQLLRLRQDDGVRLTFKGVAADDVHSEAKVREELETTVGDFDIAAAILERLGFRMQQVYEKYRETFRLGEVEVVLDELPFGLFVELEGDEAELRKAAQRLALPWAQRILDNYLLLMARAKVYYGLPFEDLTFENFEGGEYAIDAVLRGD